MKGNRVIFKMLLLAISVSLIGISVAAQELKFPQVSPAASITQTIGLTEVTIIYHRPGVKGRVIWGELVPYDQVWRTGANNATTISFSSDVKIEGNALAAGKYGLFTIPGKEEWTIIFNKQSEIWGAYTYNSNDDVLRIKVKPTEAPQCEWMNFGFTKLEQDSALAFLHWEKIMVGFTIKVETETMLWANIEKAIEDAAGAAANAASYAFKKEKFDKAKAWIDMATADKKTYWTMLLKAKIYKKLAKTKADNKVAITILEEANSLIKDVKEEYKQYATEGPALLKEWTGKK